MKISEILHLQYDHIWDAPQLQTNFSLLIMIFVI